jgi:hypothetical protein
MKTKSRRGTNEKQLQTVFAPLLIRHSNLLDSFKFFYEENDRHKMCFFNEQYSSNSSSSSVCRITVQWQINIDAHMNRTNTIGNEMNRSTWDELTFSCGQHWKGKYESKENNVFRIFSERIRLSRVEIVVMTKIEYCCRTYRLLFIDNEQKVTIRRSRRIFRRDFYSPQLSRHDNDFIEIDKQLVQWYERAVKQRQWWEVLRCCHRLSIDAYVSVYALTCFDAYSERQQRERERKQDTDRQTDRQTHKKKRTKKNRSFVHSFFLSSLSSLDQCRFRTDTANWRLRRRTRTRKEYFEHDVLLSFDC